MPPILQEPTIGKPQAMTERLRRLQHRGLNHHPIAYCPASELPVAFPEQSDKLPIAYGPASGLPIAYGPVSGLPVALPERSGKLTIAYCPVNEASGLPVA